MLASNPVTQNLIRARELVAEGWTDAPLPSQGRHCAITALGLILRSVSSMTDVTEFLLLERAAVNGLVTITSDRSRESSLAMFDRAIELSLKEVA